MRRGTRGARAARTLLTKDECDALGKRILGLLTAPEAQVRIASGVSATTALARGAMHMANENSTAEVSLTVLFANDRSCTAVTNRLDDAAMKMLVSEAEAAAQAVRSVRSSDEAVAPQRYPKPPKLFFESVPPAMMPEARAAVLHAAMEAAEAAELIAAGDLTFELSSRAVMSTAGLFVYTRGTYADLSLTARTPDGTGSGWAWSGYEDWARVEVDDVIARAVDLAQRSAKPMAVEPGRYAVILEPGAVAALVEPILQWWDARWADAGGTVFSGDPVGTNKIGLQMLDERLWMVADPWDADKPTGVFDRFGYAIPSKVVWFERGVLKNLTYDPLYAEQKRTEPVVDPGGARLYAEGATATLEEMIASTRRGIWVNRLSGVILMNQRTLLLTGTTRDGAFLIENGKITRAIKNFRFTESPFFVFNRLDAAGTPVRASRAVVCPRLKLRDFNFTSLTDAI